MAMTDTPETDGKASPIIGFYSCATAPAEFARRLERERDEARNDLEFRRELYIVQTERLERIERERDDLREAIKRLEEQIYELKS
jgi:septal ring factor EnvC (AmiA/AmiB activator)